MQAGRPHPTDAASPPPPPPQVAGHEVGEMIRATGALRVFAGRSKLGLPVEIHLVPVSALDQAFGAEEFLAAVRAAARARHESLASYTDGGTCDDGLLYAVARGAEGRTVDELIGRGGALATERALTIAASVAEALGALAEAGTRHGDLTPRRITLPGRGAVLVQPARLVPPAVAPRRARYQSPEEARGEPGDIRSDLYVLGLLLVEMLTARSPVPGSGEEARALLASDAVPPAAELLAGRPAGIVRAVACLLAPRRDERFATPRAAAAVLSALVAGATPDESLYPEQRPETAPVLTLPKAAPRSTESAAVAPTSARAPRSYDAQPAAAPGRAPPAAGRAARPPDTGDRAPGRLFLQGRLGDARLEIEEDVHVGWREGDLDVRAATEPFDGAAFRVERRADADVLVALGAGVSVDGSAVREHVLRSGETVAAPRLTGRYERGRRTALQAAPRADEELPPSPWPRRAAIGLVTVLFAAVIGFAAVRTRAVLGQGAAADAALRDASGALAAAKRRTSQKIDGPAPGPGPDRAAHDAYEAARALARRPEEMSLAQQALMRVADEHPDTAWGRLARVEALALGQSERATRSEKLDRVIADAEAQAAEGGLVDALRGLRRLADESPGTVDETILRRAIVRLDGEIQTRIQAEETAARAALAARDFQAALAALRRALDIAPFDRRDPLIRLRQQVEDAMSGVAAGGGGGTATGDGQPPPPGPTPPGPTPPGPAPPGPTPPPGTGAAAGGGDTPESAAADRDAEALTLFKASRRGMDANDHVQALQGFLRFLREFGETPTGVKYDLETRRRITSLAAGDAGVVGLFRGKVEKRDRGRWRITYDFEDPDQMLDFRDVNAFPAPPRAEWSNVSGGARAKGSGAFMLDAKFQSDFLSVHVQIEPERAHDIGIILFEHDRTDRFYLFTLQNSWFTLGGAPDSPVFRENAIVLFGPDMWAATPPGEIGFVRKAGTDEPKVNPNERIEIKAAKADAEVWLRFPGGRTIRGSAYGDKKYEFQGLSPGVFLLNSAGFFDDVVIEGTPDPDWVAARWRAILSEL